MQYEVKKKYDHNYLYICNRFIEFRRLAILIVAS